MSGGSFKVKRMLSANPLRTRWKATNTGKHLHTHTHACHLQSQTKGKKTSTATLYHIPGNTQQSNTTAKSLQSLLSPPQPNFNQPYCCGQTIVLIVSPCRSEVLLCSHSVTQKLKPPALHDGNKLNLKVNDSSSRHTNTPGCIYPEVHP